jgi:hypothetical protein
MLTEIKNLPDVAAFARQIIKEDVSFHPDDDFNDYVVIKTGKPFYTPEQAAVRNKLMTQCFEVCEKEGTSIYDIMLEVTLKETGLDKFIPLPSQASF